jgi:hypothetical protein
MNNSRNIIGFAAVFCAIIFSLWLGVNLVTDQQEILIKVAVGATLLFCILLGKKIWMIIPLLGAINLSLPLPGNPTTLLVGQGIFICFSVLLIMTRQLKLKIKFSELGFWTLLLSLCVIQTYIRNPVGLNILGGESVGARPYAFFTASLVCSMILGSFEISAANLKWIIRLSVLGSLGNFTIQSIGFFVPRVGQVFGGNMQANEVLTVTRRAQFNDSSASRIGFLGAAGRDLSLMIGSFISPIRACFHPLWAPLVLISVAFAALSGFRNEIAAVGMTYLISLAYRGGFISVFVASVTLTIGVGLIALINLTAPLPPNVQRALSFLPGTWDKIYVQDTQGSTDWRVDMWKEALFTDYWIHNKILGDGLGMSKQELDYMQSFTYEETNLGAGVGKLSRQQEFMMVSGAYHSGPVSSVRVIGYIGLIVLLLAQIRLSVHAHRQIQRAKNSEWFPLTLFVGIPLIWAPVFFVLIGGDFGSAASSLMMGAAMVRILENNLPLPLLFNNQSSSLARTTK